MILLGSRYATAAVLRVAGRPVTTPITALKAVLYLRSRRHKPYRVPIPTEQLATRTFYPTVYPVRGAGATLDQRILTYDGYEILMGDRLQDIAFKFYGDASLWHLLATANPTLFDPDDLPVGAVLLIPTLASIRLNAKPVTAVRDLTKPFDGIR